MDSLTEQRRYTVIRGGDFLATSFALAELASASQGYIDGPEFTLAFKGESPTGRNYFIARRMTSSEAIRDVKVRRDKGEKRLMPAIDRRWPGIVKTLSGEYHPFNDQEDKIWFEH